MNKYYSTVTDRVEITTFFILKSPGKLAFAIELPLFLVVKDMPSPLCLPEANRLESTESPGTVQGTLGTRTRTEHKDDKVNFR